jgi:hypothetical protein
MSGGLRAQLVSLAEIFNLYGYLAHVLLDKVCEVFFGAAKVYKGK